MAPASTYLGQFSWEKANAVAERLEAVGIGWYEKQAGAITRFFFAGEWGVRLFVDAERLEEARAIADAIPEPEGEG